jgi:hypothetical protein
MRRSTAAFATAAICILVSGCTRTGHAEMVTPTPTLVPRPLVERELASLLLTPDEVNAAMGTTGMALTGSQSAMSDNSATMAPMECLAIDGAAEAPVYANSGFWAERDESLNNGDRFTHYLKQAVVLFPTPELARAFFDASAEQWPACREYTHTQSGSMWYPGEISNVAATLSVIATQKDAAAPGWACGRALAQRNNIIVDVNTCSANPADSAPRVASLIADDVSSRW